jgi:subtilisin family serine protease
MDPLDQIKLRPLMDISSGIHEVVIGIIDGPVDFNHPALEGSRIRTVNDSQMVACKNANSIACMHGTFVAGILSAMRGAHAPGICPSCEVKLYPIFSEQQLNGNEAKVTVPSSTPEELSKAIVQTIDAGAKIINLSLGLSSSSLASYQRLNEAYDYAMRKGVILVAAAGNQGNIGYVTMLDHNWLIPVAACDSEGRIDPMSNFGRSIGKKGLMAPGIDIASTAPDGRYTRMSGTSAAAPFVTGTIALLWSIFPYVPAHKIISSLISNTLHNRTIIPPLLHAHKAYQVLEREIP